MADHLFIPSLWSTKYVRREHNLFFEVARVNREYAKSTGTPCKFCGVLPAHGHFDWCKVDRAPTAEEIAVAVILEADRSVGYDGPSSSLVGMCTAFLNKETPK